MKNDMFGIPARSSRPRVDTSEMSYPMQCQRCGNIHDGGRVTVVQRYADCSVWKCPGCGSLIDDRPIGWGGSAAPVPRGGNCAERGETDA